LGTQRRTGPPRSHSSSKGGNLRRSSNERTSRSGSNLSCFLNSSQNGQPVDSWKCHATVWETCASSAARARLTASAVAFDIAIWRRPTYKNLRIQLSSNAVCSVGAGCARHDGGLAARNCWPDKFDKNAARKTAWAQEKGLACARPWGSLSSNRRVRR